MYKLIIADDEYEIRHGLSEHFPWEDIGFEVVAIASNGQEVIDFVEKNCIDVLLCDIQMPVMSGIEVAEALHKEKKNIIIIFLSGYEEFEYAQLAIEYGVKKYILKPTKFTELFEVFTQIKMDLDRRKTPQLVQEEVTVADEVIENDDHSDMIIAKIKDYVQENLENVNLDEAANIVYMNPHYVSKYFKQKTGVNFSDYVFEQKMLEAAKLLQDVKFKVYEVSKMVGYGNSKNFTRAFRRYFKLTPSEYRRRIKWNE